MVARRVVRRHLGVQVLVLVVPQLVEVVAVSLRLVVVQPVVVVARYARDAVAVVVRIGVAHGLELREQRRHSP